MWASRIFLVKYKQSNELKEVSYVNYQQALDFAQGLASHSGYSDIELKEISLMSTFNLDLEKLDSHTDRRNINGEQAQGV